MECQWWFKLRDGTERRLNWPSSPPFLAQPPVSEDHSTSWLDRFQSQAYMIPLLPPLCLLACFFTVTFRPVRRFVRAPAEAE